MALSSRVWGVGRVFLLAGALTATFLLFAAAGMRVALRAREVTVPDLSGQAIAVASETLGPLGLRLRVQSGQHLHLTIPAGNVVAQDPPAGVTSRRQRSVKVWISAGARPSRIPPWSDNPSGAPNCGSRTIAWNCWASPKFVLDDIRAAPSLRRSHRRPLAAPPSRSWSIGASAPRLTSCRTSSALKARSPPTASGFRAFESASWVITRTRTCPRHRAPAVSASGLPDLPG